MALEIIFGLPSLDIFCRGVAVGTGRRLWVTGEWRGSDTSILGKFETIGDIVYMIPRYDFSMKFRTTIPDKVVWRNCTVGLRPNLH